MIKKVIIFSMLGIFIYACGPATEKDKEKEKEVEKTKIEQKVLTEEERSFLDNLASLCNKSFAGEQVYMKEGRESWEDKNFVMHVTVCKDDEVHIPFHLDDYESRTWMFLVDEHGLRFRHDHRYEDGTPEEKTLYGGYADGEGTQYMQKFPVDDYSVELLDDHDRKRQWNVKLAEDMSKFSYKLLYHGEIVMQADFDLTEPIN